MDFGMSGGSDPTSLLFKNGRVIFKEWLTQKEPSLHYGLSWWFFQMLGFVVGRDSGGFTLRVPFGTKQIQALLMIFICRQ
jgi:hypothetical protein